MDSRPDQSQQTDLEVGPAPRNIEGALWMLASGATFTVFLTLSKVQSATFDPGFLAFWRSGVALIVVIPVILQQGWSVMKIHQPGLILLRSLFGTLGFALGFYAVSDAVGLPLSEFNAISFSRAMFVTFLAAFILKERVGVHRWGATIAGCVGVMIMMQPQLGISLGMVLAVSAAFCLAGAITLVKSLTRLHRPVTLLIWANLLSSILLLPLAILTWPDVAPSVIDWSWIGLMGVCGVTGQYFYIRGMSVGDASFLSPIDYMRLPMAALVDWGLFHMRPGFWTGVGTAIIIGATLYITIREQRLRRLSAPPL